MPEDQYRKLAIAVVKETRLHHGIDPNLPMQEVMVRNIALRMRGLVASLTGLDVPQIHHDMMQAALENTPRLAPETV